MDSLTKEQRDILLDHYFECASEQEAIEARNLLATHDGAVEFYQKLAHSLSVLEHLDHFDDAQCPEHLVEKTIDKLHKHHAGTPGQSRLGELLEAERERIMTKRPGFWRRFGEVAAIAAAVLIVAGLFVPVTRYMRAQAWEVRCNANLARIAAGIVNYAADNDRRLPAVATKAGSPWWKVGSMSDENQSNTRHVWLLVKGNYVKPDVFVCPGRFRGKALQLDSVKVQQLRDFPDRRYITYSFKLVCDSNKAILPPVPTVLMSDANPIFEGYTGRFDYYGSREFEPLELCEKLLNANSKNHRGKGQNVLFSDGSVIFMRTRTHGESTDDIFTVQDTRVYRGIETPSCETDIFLVP